MIKEQIKEILYRIRGHVSLKRLKKKGFTCGANFHMMEEVIIDPAHCWLIHIGNNVTLAPRVHLLAHDASTKMFIGYAKIGRVEIGNNVFIGASTVVLPNVKIEDNVIVGANSVVTKALNKNGVYAGNPAKYICSLEEYLHKQNKKMKQAKIYSDEYTVRNKKMTKEMKEQMYNELNQDIGFVK